MTRRRHEESGFTLVEMVMAMTLSGILLAAIVSAIVVGVDDTGQAAKQLAQSDDRQLVQIWLPRDATSAQNSSNGTSSCAQALPSGSQVVLVLTGSGVTVTTTAQGPAQVATYPYEADYVLVPSSHQLLRYYCPSGGTATSSLIVAHQLSAATSAFIVTSGMTVVTLNMTDTAGNAFAVSSGERA
ncbi:MAG TPA: type II secretion system protein [Acidimicrobiales bacterium]|nr:type II secretion system protein [Acidimicrobiales bacterium]